MSYFLDNPVYRAMQQRRAVKINQLQ